MYRNVDVCRRGRRRSGGVGGTAPCYLGETTGPVYPSLGWYCVSWASIRLHAGNLALKQASVGANDLRDVRYFGHLAPEA